MHRRTISEPSLKQKDMLIAYLEYTDSSLTMLQALKEVETSLKSKPSPVPVTKMLTGKDNPMNNVKADIKRVKL